MIGTHRALVPIDVRNDEDFDAGAQLIPASYRCSHTYVAEWADDYAGQQVVVACTKGLILSHGAAAWLRHAGATAENLEGGTGYCAAAELPMFPVDKMPLRDPSGCTLWVTRMCPKIDRIACLWLIWRFVDLAAVFLFVAPSEVEAAGDQFGAAPFDMGDIFWSHRGERCTFHVMVVEFGLASPALLRLATIVRGADTDKLDLAPELPGLLAVSLGLSHAFADDLEQLDTSMTLYDGLYRWCSDAQDESHDWPPRKNKD